MFPWKRLFLRIRTRKLDLIPRIHGKTSEILLFPMSKTSNLLQFSKDSGILPCNWLLLRSRVCKAEDARKVSGIFPLSIFPLKSKT
ncbi:hypothetical protein LINPERPRIM_LOCUS12475 [Linum perenne]